MIKIISIFLAVTIVGCADTYNKTISEFKKTKNAEALFKCGGINSTYKYKILGAESGEGVIKEKRPPILSINVDKTFDNGSKNVLTIQYEVNQETFIYKFRSLNFSRLVDGSLNKTFIEFCDGNPPFLISNDYEITGELKEKKGSIVGSYDLSSPKRGSQLDIKILSNNQYFGHINAYYEIGKIEDGMVNICDIQGILKPISQNKYVLNDDDSEVILTITNAGINVMGTKLNGCGLGVSESVIGNYKKIVDKK
jgi:hypothetical protein